MSTPKRSFGPATSFTDLEDFIDRHRRLFVLTGAGCSTRSGIPDYRDAAGNWKRASPMTYQVFMGSQVARQRYWARSMVGLRHFAHVRPNDAHRALASLEAMGRTEVLVTQNVDGLHQAGGSEHVIDLHGRLDQVRCMGCERRTPRAELQIEFDRLNPGWVDLQAVEAPDGDADLEGREFTSFQIPPCRQCGGVLKPDIVFFGESVPGDRRDSATRHLAQADAMLIVGSSLMVHSGFSLVQTAADSEKPIAAINIGRTRADGLLSLKAEQACEAALAFLLR
jgi:NAD-dependent SIR2 family protein deacetylase